MYRLNLADSGGFDYELITKLTKIVKNNARDLLPISNSEAAKLKRIAVNYGVDIEQLFSIRNLLRIHIEIISMNNFESKKKLIIQKFNRLVATINNNNVIDDNFDRIDNFNSNTRIPFKNIYKLITKSKDSDFSKLDNIYKAYIHDMNKFIDSVINQEKINARNFEKSVEKYLTLQGLKYKTEMDLKKDGIDSGIPTPDILFEHPVQIEINGEKRKIKWIDAKNFILIKIPFIFKKLKNQALKYNEYYGPGAFIFHYGYDNSLKIPDTLIIDGSFLDR